MTSVAGLYNLRRFLNHVSRILAAFFNFQQAMPSSPSFCDVELHRALSEQAFGIKSFTVSSSSPQQAIATIVLLDGPKLSVQLTTQGYSVVSNPKVYETIEDLLAALSPMYAKMRQETLYAKLSKLTS